MKSRPGPLADYDRERALAEELGVHQRTLARPRSKGKIRFLHWGGEVWDHRGDVYAHIASRVTRRNQPRDRRRQARRTKQ